MEYWRLKQYLRRVKGHYNIEIALSIYNISVKLNQPMDLRLLISCSDTPFVDLFINYFKEKKYENVEY